ncbi:16S rRNA (uracil(1498)-N(3))-methyltransferase [Ferruginibacter sp. HRS2-29]|uniref:RsmE family RNA methyltransferase n=1 Tax=Ferruginibacter sp. HRS2-29 TaxID=2487334 RepID=UPI0020CC2FE0|nr:RsmE family RNA methyltransferase [Ferruginibacter sp. HRS2-29]MCP9752137.1 16S rRNA (uracil(1498)-N(3))-methyltransferase [Ferruginibacter sp. HRS2-29]
MALPFFYIEQTDGSGIVQLNEETSKHVVQVLRMKNEEQLQLTDGKGNLFTCTIIDDHRKKCVVRIDKTDHTPEPEKKITIAVSLVKNNTRFEWFLEKATEIGVSSIIPLLCTRTEKQHFRTERMKGILVSAMLQSQQTWLPELPEPVKFNVFIEKAVAAQKFIAHCEEENDKKELTAQMDGKAASQIMLIGPEGDFTKEEIENALKQGFIPVSLGNTRLRTETAGMVAAALMVNHSYKK